MDICIEWIDLVAAKSPTGMIYKKMGGPKSSEYAGKISVKTILFR